MKTFTITMILATLLSTMILANDIDRDYAVEQFNIEKNNATVSGGEKVLQIGPKFGENDGVEFIFNGKKLGKGRKSMYRGARLTLEIQVINTTGKKAYMMGWFDFNNNGTAEKREKVLFEVVRPTKKNRIQKISRTVRLPKNRLKSDAGTFAYFELTSDAGSLGTQSDDQHNNDSQKKEQMHQDSNHSTIGTSAVNGDKEIYDILFTDEDPVAVTLSSFNAIETANGIALEWRVESEMNHAGYNLYRSENEEYGFTKINDAIILGWDGFSAFDGCYEYTDAVYGAYYYKLEAVEMDGSTEMFGPYSVMSTTNVESKLDMPESFDLKQNYPNPFNPSTTISFSLAENTNVSITIFDITGRIVSRLVNGTMEAGVHNVTWNAVDNYGSSLPTGIYFYTMNTANFTATNSMTIMK